MIRGVFFVLLLAVSISQAQGFPFRAVREGDPLPSAKVFDISSGKYMDIKDLVGDSVAVVLFWGADSPYKRKHSLEVLKELVPLSNQMKIGLYPVNVQRDPENDVKSLLKEAGYAGPVLIDRDRDAYKAFGVFVMPSVVVAKDGKIFKGFGYTHNLAEVIKVYCEVALGLKTEKQAEAELHPEQKEMSPEEKEALRFYRLGLSMLEKGMASRAESAFRRALEAKADYTDARVGLAVTLLLEGKLDQLGKELAFLEKKISDDFRVKILKARYLLEKGNVDEAYTVASTLVFAKPGCPDVYVLLGDVYFRKKDWEKAASYYRKALDKCYHLGRLVSE